MTDPPSPPEQPGDTPPSSSDPNSLRNPPKPPSPQLSFPLNYLHVLVQFLILLSLLPYHATVYSLFPSKRPRKSWTLLDTVFLLAVKRYLAMIDTAGFKISARDVFSKPRGFGLRRFMSGTTFEWIDEGDVEEDLVQGSIIDDEDVEMRTKVGCFSWYRKERRSGKGTEKCLEFAREEGELVGIFFHGGVSNLFDRCSESWQLMRVEHRGGNCRLLHTIQHIQNLSLP
jgi:hypothetical protein